MRDIVVHHHHKHHKQPYKIAVRVRYEQFVPRTERTYCWRTVTVPGGGTIQSQVPMKVCKSCDRKFATGSGLAYHKQNFPLHK